MTSYIEYSEKGKLHSYEKAPQTVGTYHVVIDALVERAGQILSAESTSLLDIGAGNGIYAQALLEYGFHVTALDPSPASMRMTTSPKIYSTLEDSQLPINNFDIIHIKDVLEHLPNKGTFFSSCSRVLRSPGIIMCVFNAIPSIVEPNVKTPPNQKYTLTTFDQIRTAALRSGILFDDELLFWRPSEADDDWYEKPLIRAIAIGTK